METGEREGEGRGWRESVATENEDITSPEHNRKYVDTKQKILILGTEAS